jgi:hypothetical protein
VNDLNPTALQSTPPWAPVPAAPAALTAAYAALAGTSMAGAASIVVTALDAAGLLQAPGENTALRQLVAQATGYSALYTQTCEHGQHREWYAEVAEAIECPWCLVARLQSTAGKSYRVQRGSLTIGTYSSFEAAGTHAETELRHRFPGATCRWTPNPDDSDVIRLLLLADDHRFGPTEYSVITVDVLAAYDPEADA